MNRIDMIGMIAKENAVWRACEGSRQTVFINGNNQLQYSIQALMPLDERDNRFFTGYLNNLEAYGFNENYYADAYVRASEFEEIMENYLIIFNPVENGSYMRIENAALTIKPSGYEEGMSFRSIPFYTSAGTLESFVKDWQQKCWMQCSQGIDLADKVPFVLWQPIGTTNVYCIGGNTSIRSYQEKLCLPAIVNTYELTKEEKQLVIINPRDEMQGIAFVETGICDSLIYQMSCQQETFSQEAASQPYIAQLSGDAEILENLYSLTASSGFSYSKRDIINFHTALKTKGLVILEGISGTGKSRLVDFYRQAAGMDEKHYKCLSVKASWTDESDLLGYLDMMNNCYRPDHEGVVDLLLDAEKHPEELYLLCFDEMNLARVEHYFSQFLSILEMDKNQQVLRLYNEALNVVNQQSYPPAITLKGNVLFVGTINKDESTHHFSDKVLDRANVIKLGIASLKDLYRMEKADSAARSLTEKKWTAKEYFGEEVKKGQAVLTEEEIELLDNVHQMLTTSQYDKGIGYRIIRQIENYLYHLPKDQQELNRQEAFDLQFAQRILSKLRGDRMSLEGILVREEDDIIPLMECLTASSHLSEFRISRKIIEQKVKALKCYGYTM